MDRFQLVYGILHIKCPGGYRNAKGLKVFNSLQIKSTETLQKMYDKLKANEAKECLK